MSKPRAPNIRCVYCKQSKPRPRKGEHIILAGLGGVTTIPDVCFECNQRLGRDVDEEFLRKSFLALRRFIDPAVVEGEAPSPQFTKTDFGYLDIRLFNNGSMRVSPQILLDESRVRIGSSPEERDKIMEVVEQVKSEGEACLKIHLLDVEEHVPARIVAGKKNRHLLRARTQEEADRLVQLTQKVSPGNEYHDVPIKPDVAFKVSMDLNSPGRCATKMAFNAATHIFGPEVMLREAYDPVRRYILGEELQEGPATTDDGEEGLLVDHRFVDDWFGNREPLRGVADYHPIYLGPRHGLLCCSLDVFGGAHRFFVRLGPLPETAKERLPVALLSLKEGGEVWFHRHTMKTWRPSQLAPWDKTDTTDALADSGRKK